MIRAPESIETDRLRLRRPVAADAESIFQRYAADPEVTRYLGWPTHRSIADTHAFLGFSDAEWMRWPASAYLIEARDTRRLLGSTGLTFESATAAETGYVLARDAWGQGFATEALRAMVRLAPSLGVGYLYAQCHPDHHPSRRVLEKAGFTRDRTLYEHPGFPNLTGGGPTLVLRYMLRFDEVK
jgi:RimJ/RimL family protein N-acetyltransferase